MDGGHLFFSSSFALNYFVSSIFLPIINTPFAHVSSAVCLATINVVSTLSFYYFLFILSLVYNLSFYIFFLEYFLPFRLNFVRTIYLVTIGPWNVYTVKHISVFLYLTEKSGLMFLWRSISTSPLPSCSSTCISSQVTQWQKCPPWGFAFIWPSLFTILWWPLSAGWPWRVSISIFC